MIYGISGQQDEFSHSTTTPRQMNECALSTIRRIGESHVYTAHVYTAYVYTAYVYTAYVYTASDIGITTDKSEIGMHDFAKFTFSQMLDILRIMFITIHPVIIPIDQSITPLLENYLKT